MNARPNLRLVDQHGELQGEQCLACVEKDVRLAQLRRKITELENLQEQKVERRDPLDGQIMEVCTFHKRILSPNWRIVRKRGAYNDVRDRLNDVDAETGERAFSVLHLRAASVGMWICAWTRDRNLRSASWLFGRTGNVQWMIDEAVSFKRDTGTSALTLVDELGRAGLEKLAARCSCCGHLRLDHERERPELDLFDPPCAVHGCHCVAFDDLDWKVEVWKGRQDELAARREVVA